MNIKLKTQPIKIREFCIGYSLIEVMISLVLGILVTTGIFQIYISNKQSYRLVEGQSRLQENARFALSFLTEDIRLAGYTGCVSRGVILTSTLNTPAGYLYNLANPIEGFEWDVGANNWAAQPAPLPVVDPSIEIDLSELNLNSDIITVRRATTRGFSVSTHANGAANVVYISNPALAQLSACDLVVISNCSAATIFQISSIPNPLTVAHAINGCSVEQPDNASADFLRSYAGGQIFSYQNTSYYIKDFNGIPTLYRRINSQLATALIEGVELMQVIYGVDSTNDGNIDQFFNADQFSPTTVGGPNWNQVSSVRISLLMRSIEPNLVLQPVAVNFNGVAVNVADRRLRRQFTATIAIRNTLQ